MTAARTRGTILLAFLVATAARAESTPTGKPVPSEVRSLAAFPERVSLRGSDACRQLVVTAESGELRLLDLTGDVSYEVADGSVARVTPSGRVLPVSDGNTEIRARYGERHVSIPIEVSASQEDLPINFANQVVPLFTKMGCNSGGCHGKLSGQNGFHLSLLGFEPDVDFAALVQEARGRRVFAAAPEYSLLLRKASGQTAHGGGKRLEVGSDEYRRIRRWVAAGTPYGRPEDPVVTRVQVFPEQRVLSRQDRQQLAVLAHYSDGTVEDVTALAQYDSNDLEVAVVEGTGLVHTLGLSGEAAVMARYQGHVTVFRATVPLGKNAPSFTFEPRTVVDRYTVPKWRELGIVPSDLCTDEQFVRRVYLDVTGTLPTPAQVLEFLADPAAGKRAALVDRLVDSPEYAYCFANRWADVLRVKRGNNQQGRAYGTFVFHDWIRAALEADKPYDEMVREILSAVGDESRCPPAVWYKDLQTADQFADNLAQVFLGTRIQCAQCHHHPYEKWSQDDYWGLAAFYGRLGRKAVPTVGVSNQNQQQQRQILFVRPTGTVINKQTNKPAVPRPLDGSALELPAGVDPRQTLADWMVDGQNPFFARAVVNRYWGHFFGRGLVDPIDDMRVTNPPSNPALLAALARDFVEHHFSLKHLVKTLCKSRTYQLSSTPNAYNKQDKQAFARYYPRHLPAEVLFDAVSQVTGSPAKFNGVPDDTHGLRRALMLPDESFSSYFLDVFGRPQRLSACECERVTEANLAQVLHLLNSDEVQGKIARPGGRADLLARDPRPDAEKVEELFLWTLGHKPDRAKLEQALDHLQRNAKNKKAGYENLLWALINTKAFGFNY